MKRISILGAGIARRLTSQLKDKPVTHVAATESNKCNFTLRRCYARRQGEAIATGGMVLFLRSESEFPKIHLRPLKREVRISPSRLHNLSRIINAAVVEFIEAAQSERERQQWVAKVDAAAAPFIGNEKFLRAVEKREKKVGDSNYDKLSIRSCRAWLGWIQEWNHPAEIPAHDIEGSLAEFNRYIAGDR